MTDRETLLILLRDAKDIAAWNYRLKSMSGDTGAERDMWSAVLGHIENAVARMESG